MARPKSDISKKVIKEKSKNDTKRLQLILLITVISGVSECAFWSPLKANYQGGLGGLHERRKNIRLSLATCLLMSVSDRSDDGLELFFDLKVQSVTLQSFARN